MLDGPRAMASVGAQARAGGVSRLTTIIAEPWADWGLIDCGNGQKFERYGRDPGRPSRAAGDVGARRATIGTRTRPSFPAPTRRAAGAGSSIGPCRRQWELSRGDVRFQASLTPFRHLGFFPDMAPQWDWMRERAGGRRGAQPVRLHRGRHACC